MSEEGASVAKAVVALSQTSVTGSEYPTLFTATREVAADMFAMTEQRMIVIEAKAFRPRSRHRPEDDIVQALQRAATRAFEPNWRLLRMIFDAQTVQIPTPHGDVELARELSSGLEPTDAVLLAMESVRARIGERWDPSFLDQPDEVGTDENLIELAEELGGVAAEAPPITETTGNLPRDVLVLTGLTAAELANTLGRTERSVRGWIADGQAPSSMRTVLEQLRTIALRLIGGIGPEGVREWLLSGDPGPLSRIARGEAADVVAETDRLLDSPAT